MGNLVERIKRGESIEIRCNPFGDVNQYVIGGSTFVPKGNDHFERIQEYLKKQGQHLQLVITWVQVVKDKEGKTLHYITDKGPFVDADSNPITTEIKERLSTGGLEQREVEKQFMPSRLEISIFLPRSFTLNNIGSKSQEVYIFDSKMMGLPFDVSLGLRPKIESDYFRNNGILEKRLRNIQGNVLRIEIDRRTIKRVYKWAIKSLDFELDFLEESLNVDMALHKRQKSRGPRWVSW